MLSRIPCVRHGALLAISRSFNGIFSRAIPLVMITLHPKRFHQHELDREQTDGKKEQNLQSLGIVKAPVLACQALLAASDSVAGPESAVGADFTVGAGTPENGSG